MVDFCLLLVNEQLDVTESTLSVQQRVTRNYSQMELIQYYIQMWNQRKYSFEEEADRLIQDYGLLPDETMSQWDRHALKELVSRYLGGRHAYLDSFSLESRMTQCKKLFEFYSNYSHSDKKRPCLLFASKPHLALWLNWINLNMPSARVRSFRSIGDINNFQDEVMLRDVDVVVMSYNMLLSRSMWETCRFGIVVFQDAYLIHNAYPFISSYHRIRKESKMIILLGNNSLKKTPDKHLSILALVEDGMFPRNLNASEPEYNAITSFVSLAGKPQDSQSKGSLKLIQTVTFVKLTPSQQELYNEIAHHHPGGVTSSEVQCCLRVCNHLLLVTHEQTSGLKDLLEKSGKMQELDRILQTHISSGERVVLCAQNSEMRSLLYTYLQLKRYTFWEVNYRSSKQNIDWCRWQNNPINVLLFTSPYENDIRIDILEANVVVVFNTAGNFQLNDRVVDRVYTTGQTKNVYLYTLVTEGTMEQKMFHEQQELFLEKQRTALQRIGYNRDDLIRRRPQSIRFQAKISMRKRCAKQQLSNVLQKSVYSSRGSLFSDEE